MIDIEATIEGHQVFITFVYGDPVVEYREYVWEILTRMSLQRTGPWLLLGDFNEIISNSEKKGGRRRTDASFIPFRTILANCGMIDFPYKGNPLSWVGNRASGKVQCRLDRAVGNEDWHHDFSHTNVEYLRLWGSDHRPILTRFLSFKNLAKKGFKFDKRWVGKDGFRDAILKGWKDPSLVSSDDLYDRIACCRKFISRWKRNSSSNSAKKIEEIKTQLEQAQVADEFTQ